MSCPRDHAVTLYMCTSWDQLSNSSVNLSTLGTLRSLIINRNNHGPSLIPWGTPAGTGPHSEKHFRDNLTRCCTCVKTSVTGRQQREDQIGWKLCAQASCGRWDRRLSCSWTRGLLQQPQTRRCACDQVCSTEVRACTVGMLLLIKFTYWMSGRAGRENIFLQVRTYGPIATSIKSPGGLIFFKHFWGGVGLIERGRLFNLAKRIKGSKASRGWTCGFRAIYCFF